MNYNLHKLYIYKVDSDIWMTSHTLPPSPPDSVLGSMEYGAGARRRRCGASSMHRGDAVHLQCQHLRHCFIGTHFWYWSQGTPTTKLTHQKRQRVYISSPKSLRSTFTSSQPAIKQSGTTTNRRDPLWFPFGQKAEEKDSRWNVRYMQEIIGLLNLLYSL